MNILATLDFKNHEGVLPIIVPYSVGLGDSGFILVCRLKEDELEKEQ